jgi:hypothetical protein
VSYSTYSVLLGVLAFAAGLVYRSRLTRVIRSGEPVLTDDMVRQIEEQGRVDVDEPLDLEQIQDEEARFWEEQWDEPDEW